MFELIVSLKLDLVPCLSEVTIRALDVAIEEMNTVGCECTGKAGNWVTCRFLVIGSCGGLNSLLNLFCCDFLGLNNSLSSVFTGMLFFLFLNFLGVFFFYVAFF